MIERRACVYRGGDDGQVWRASTKKERATPPLRLPCSVLKHRELITNSELRKSKRRVCCCLTGLL
jgi:hypothetical protein